MKIKNLENQMPPSSKRDLENKGQTFR